MNILVLVIGSVLIYGAGFASGWRVDAWKNGAEQARELKVQIDNADRAREERDRIANRFEKKLSNLRITNTTINREVRHEVEKTVYGDPNCNLPASGVRLRNSAIEAANRAASSESDAAVPTHPTDASGKANDSRGALPK